MAKGSKRISSNPFRQFFRNIRGVPKKAGRAAGDALIGGAAFKKKKKPKRVKAK